MRLAEVILLVLQLLTLRSTGSTGADQRASANITFPLPPNCPKMCGNISIEYPFGIGSGCFREGFNLTCTDQTRLFLGDGALEVIKFDMDEGLVYVKTPIVTLDADADSITSSLIDLDNWPYSFNSAKALSPHDHDFMTNNTLYVVGCSAIADLVDPNTNNTIATCFTICSADREEFSAGSGCSFGLSDMVLGNQTSLEVRLTRLNISELHLLSASSVRAFVSSMDIGGEDLQGIIEGRITSLEVGLAWYMNDHPSCEGAQNNTDTYACLSHNSDCQNVLASLSCLNCKVGYHCECSSTYQGNPYLPNGCQDTSFTPSPANDCETECGGVDISFPFGLKQGCYRDESFALTCHGASDPPTLLLKDHYIVSNILLEEGQLELKDDDRSLFFMNITKPFALIRQGIINWVIAFQPCDDAMKNMTTFACVDEHSSCVDSNTTLRGLQLVGYRCVCAEGYVGNPYLADGCEDIDECSLPENYACHGICTNTEGNYNCTCQEGTYGDPKQGACIPDKKKTILLGVIIGLSNGLGLFSLCTSFVIFKRKWEKTKQKIIREKHFRQNHRLLLQKLISSSEDMAERTKIFSLAELEKATNNFDETRVLGHGGHGTVYKGILSDQRIVAIKKPKFVERSEIDQFINEVAILSQINHRNVVKLFGCCLETEVPLLIYEFISNGTLSDHLHIPNGSSTLSWEDRLRIAAETAGALSYLHSAASISVFHRDIKLSNILLDDHFTAKVSDFGASRCIPLDQTHVFTAIQGTFGYLDPEYYQTSQLTEKSDVYSFGVILLELLTGNKQFFSNSEDKALKTFFFEAVREKRAFELVDSRVMDEGTKEELLEIIQLIEMCLKLNGVERPTIEEVEYKLESLRKTRILKRGFCVAEGSEGTKNLLNNPSFAPPGSVGQTLHQGPSRNYSLEEEFMWSQQHPR